MSMSRASSLPHSHSTPLSGGHDGGGSTTPRSTLSSSTKTPPPPLPVTPGKNRGKIIEVKIITLDDSANLFQVQVKAIGRVLFDQVCKQLNLLEADYFGLEYQDGRSRNWLDLEKPLHRQVGFSLVDPVLWFCVKFYTPDPSTQLEEEFTRYLFCLQIKRDLSQGLLHCNENTAALMASYIVQAECGDYVSEDYPDHTYLSSYKFVPNQTPELERRIMENHKKHAGQSPAAADLNLLETARRCELYGVKLHPAKDHDNILLNLSVAHMGILVFQNQTKINTFSWAKIRKISFKRKRFLIKLHPEGYGYYKDIVEFLFDNRNDCKNFWKKCVENHGFFRCSAVKNTPRQRTRVLSRGSSFRYSGKTQKQIVEFVRENYVKRQTFQRSQSFRNSNTLLSASSEPPLSAQPLLPITIETPSLAGANSTVASPSYGIWTSSSLGTGPGVGGGKVYPTTTQATKSREAFDEIQPATASQIQNQNGGVLTGSSTPGQSRKKGPAAPKTTTPASRSSPTLSPPPREAIVDVHDTTTTTNSDLSSLSSSIQPPDTTPAGGPPTSTRKYTTLPPTGYRPHENHAYGVMNSNVSHEGGNYGLQTNNLAHETGNYLLTNNENQSGYGMTNVYPHMTNMHDSVTYAHLTNTHSSGNFYQRRRSENASHYQTQTGSRYFDDAGIYVEDGFRRGVSARRSDSSAHSCYDARPTQRHKSSQTELASELEPPRRFTSVRDPWTKSASCKELNSHSYYSYNDNFTYSSLLDRKPYEDRVTKYDDTYKSTTNLSKQSSFDRDVLPDVLTETKIYSSSYPGTTSSLSDSSAMEQPTKNTLLSSSYEEMYDEVSHDSYELLEKEELYAREYYDPGSDALFMSNESIKYIENLPPDGVDYESPLKDHDEHTFHENFNLTSEMIERVNDPVFAIEDLGEPAGYGTPGYRLPDAGYGKHLPVEPGGYRLPPAGESSGYGKLPAETYRHRLGSEPSESFHECDLNFVEPKYTNLNFSEFNEICKRGYSRSRELLNFDLIGGRNSVERTKSDPYVNTVARRSHRHHHHHHHNHHRPAHTRYHYYKKLNPVNTTSAEALPKPAMATSSEGSFENFDDNLSKSAIDIPYTLHKRHVMNGTARDSKKHSPKRSQTPLETKDSDVSLNTGGNNTYNNSKDSGLSLSVGTENSTDENGDLSPPDILLMNKYDKVLTTSESSLIADVIGVTKRKNSGSGVSGAERKSSSSGSERKLSIEKKSPPAGDAKKDPTKTSGEKERERKFSVDAKKQDMVKTALEKFAEKRIEKVRDSSEKLGEKRRNSLEKLKEMEKFNAGRRGSVEKVRDSAGRLGEKRRDSLEKRRESLEKLKLKDSIELKKEKDTAKRESLSDFKTDSIEEGDVEGDAFLPEPQVVTTDTESVTSDEVPKKDHCGKLKETFGNLKDSLELAKQNLKNKRTDGKKDVKDSLSDDSSSSIPPGTAPKMDSIADEEDEIINQLKNEIDISEEVEIPAPPPETERKSSLKKAEISIDIQKSDDDEIVIDEPPRTAELTKMDTLELPGLDKPAELTKVKSMDESHNAGSKKVSLEKVRQVKSADYAKRSFEKQDSKSSLKSFRQDSFGSTKGGVKVIKIDSDDICTCDKAESSEGGVDKQENNVIIVEYRSTKKKKLTKRSSSGSKDKEEAKLKERTSSTSSMEKESISPCRPDSISPSRQDSLSPCRPDSVSPMSASPKQTSPRKDTKPAIKPKPKIIKIDTKKDGTIVSTVVKKSKSLEKEIEKKLEARKSKSLEKEDKKVVKKTKSTEKKDKPVKTDEDKSSKEKTDKVAKSAEEKPKTLGISTEKPKSSKHSPGMENPTIKIQKCTSEEKVSSSEDSEKKKKPSKSDETKNVPAKKPHSDEVCTHKKPKKKPDKEKSEAKVKPKEVPDTKESPSKVEPEEKKEVSKLDSKEATKTPKAEIIKYVVSKLKNVDIKPKVEAKKTDESEKNVEKPKSLKINIGKGKETAETKNDKSPTSGAKKSLKSPESQWKKFSELPSATLIAPKRERSPILFARLGLSDGSAYVPTSPSVSRRAKSLDSPVVSLQNLPPVTSFSSKDDTLENEDVVELEVKSIKTSRLPSISDDEENDAPLKVCPKKADVEEPIKKKSSAKKERTSGSKTSSVEKQDTKDTTTTDEESEKLIQEKKEKIKILKSVVSQLKEIKRKSSKEGDENLKEQKSVEKGDSIDLDKVPEAAVEDDMKAVNDKTDESRKTETTEQKGVVKSEGQNGSKQASVEKSPEKKVNEQKAKDDKRKLSEGSKKKSSGSSSESDKDIPRKVMNLLELDEIIRSKQSSFEVSADTIIDEVPEGFLDSAKNSFDQDSGSVDEKLNVNNTIKELLTLVNSPRDDQSLSPGDGKSLTPERRSSQSLTPDRKSSTSITPERRSSGTPERRPSGTPERRSSTRQERLDSFKKLKNFSMDIWNSDEVEKNINPEDKPEDEFDEDDDAFLPPDEPPGKVEETLPGSGVEVKGEDQQEEPEAEEAKDLERPEDDRDLLSEINKELLEVLNVKDIIFEVRTPVNIPEKRSFDEEPSTSSYGKQFPLESSGSSSLDEVNLPVDDNDETCELDEFPTNIAYPTHAELMLSNFNSNTYLNRTLSRISERSTTSEQERSDFEDDISSKPSSSRSVSVDDESLMSSDRQPSLSSDPPSIHEHFDETELPPLPPLPMEPMKSFDETEWPSPPEALTPLVTSVENYFNYRKETEKRTEESATHKVAKVGEHCKSVLDLRKIGESSDDDVFKSVKVGEESFPLPPEPFTPIVTNVSSYFTDKITLSTPDRIVVEKDDFDSDNDSKTLEGDDEPEEALSEDLAAYDDVKLTPTMTRPRSSVGDDTSLGDWSSSTGTTVLHCRHYSSTGLPKSDDSSLAGFSLSNEVLNETNSRKNSEEFGRLSSTTSGGYFPVKQRSFDGFENPMKSKLSHYVRPQRSFDEYDSPYTESEDNTESRTLCFTESDDTTDSRQLPYPLPLYKKPMYTLTSPTKHAKRKLSDRSKKHQMSLATPLANLSSSFDATRSASASKGATNVRSKSYSYYSLNRSQPSDDSSSESSMDRGGSKKVSNTPNTIPRVSKRKRKSPSSSSSGKKFSFLNYNLDGKQQF
ncbi:hypothetical protein M8J77_002495 [Diaphorina citri]|nr:hypothetical protein M8J77_002495 [Diaphorina citri]